MNERPSPLTRLLDGVAEVLATWFGCGRSRIAPGTVGSLGTLPLYWLIKDWAVWPYWTLVGGLCLAGTWAAGHLANRLGQPDPQSVVIDEATGLLIAFGILQSGRLELVGVVFVLFRLFDIWKPGLVRLAERLKPKALGIMADDWVAGLFAGGLGRAIAVFAFGD